MVVAVRAEAVITAQNKLKPGLAAAARELSRFQAMQTKATAAFSSTAARMGAAAHQRIAAASSAAAALARSQAVTLGGPAALAASYKQFADVDRQITNIGITSDASADDLASVRKQIEGIAHETAQSSGKVTGGLEVLVSQGRSLKESLEFLPSVARTAAASNSAVADIAKTAGAVGSNFKIAGREMQTAFDIMAVGGKAGEFELKDQSQFLPELAPAAAAAGFSGTRGLSQLVAMLQVIRKGSGSSSAAFDSMNNILQKMESQETQTKFKKFGVDLAAGMAKGRKEGRNLVAVFEELTERAIKGDLSKLPQLFSDMQFARGMRALMSYRGEWQKLDKVIMQTAAGTVARDLTRVTNDARAQIDRMFGAVENRAVQLGGILAKHIVLPLDEQVKRIERGENETLNRIDSFAQRYNADIIARAEMRNGERGNYDPATRARVDARTESLRREGIDAERRRLNDEISRLEAKRQGIISTATAETAGKAFPGPIAALHQARTKALTDPLDAQIAASRSKLDELNALVARIDQIKRDLADNATERAKVTTPSMGVPTVAADVASMAEAGTRAGRAFREAMKTEVDQVEADLAPAIARVKALLSFTARPTVRISTPSGSGPGGFDTGRQGPN